MRQAVPQTLQHMVGSETPCCTGFVPAVVLVIDLLVHFQTTGLHLTGCVTMCFHYFVLRLCHVSGPRAWFEENWEAAQSHMKGLLRSMNRRVWSESI
jgi:hypothetical protein